MLAQKRIRDACWRRPCCGSASQTTARHVVPPFKIEKVEQQKSPADVHVSGHSFCLEFQLLSIHIISIYFLFFSLDVARPPVIGWFFLYHNKKGENGSRLRLCVVCHGEPQAFFINTSFGLSAAASTGFSAACSSAFWHMATASQTGLPFSSVTSSSP